jgi:signal transduction histidine kinase
MIKPDIHIHEKERLQALDSYSILDTLQEDEYDSLTFLASQICETPVAIIGFVDENRHWFKSAIGINDRLQNPREYSFCAHAIQDSKAVFIVPDAREDIRFHDNPLVTGEMNVVFYAGVSLVNDNFLPLGTICVIDHKPNSLSANQIKSLEALSQQTMRLLELRVNKTKLEDALHNLENKNKDLEEFAYTAAHDLKSPLANISGLTDFLIENYNDNIDEEGIEIIQLIKSSSLKLRDMIEGLLVYSKSNKFSHENYTKVSIFKLEKELIDLFSFNKNCDFVLQSELQFIETNKTALEQILINLVSNAIKYSDKERTKIEILISEDVDYYKITVSDNGAGIEKEHQKVIFEIFEVAIDKDRFGEKGHGIGLATVKKIIDNMGGNITVNSEIGLGATFDFTLAKAEKK